MANKIDNLFSTANLTKRLDQLRQEMVQDVREEHLVGYLAKRLETMAEVEGQLYVARIIERLESRAVSKEGIMANLADIMIQGADDTWSGRNNDVTRSRHDGILRVCRHYRDSQDWS